VAVPCLRKYGILSCDKTDCDKQKPIKQDRNKLLNVLILKKTSKGVATLRGKDVLIINIPDFDKLAFQHPSFLPTGLIESWE